ncbi:YhcH/YjgK/YiaL family protein [Carboxylicivirga marina]|uniref:YhcH/YjgK/YiaL family protein n=1 Tax=Carboxylicivirga marina TaxID=2800988 RepID=A0ABS1HH85_9BACT|nr:YhcH/YjgK/YiaL family protein [Carboxylicivirga marina]MBK3517043.1 YhcH/YjgK/YiaL family protein [Carboxylicivirga marina]
MAIIGTLATLNKQSSEHFRKALNYLENTDLDALFNKVAIDKPLEVEIDGRSVFAIFQTYETKGIEEANMEGHRKYIDLQYIHKGIEQILVSPTSRMVKEGPYSEDKDLHFSKVADYSSFRLSNGMGCILFPEDLHAPCINIDAPSKVEKIVIKIAIDK